MSPTGLAGRSEPAIDTVISLERLALSALRADSAFALLSAPYGHSAIANPGAPFAPTCDATSASAQSVTSEVNGSTLVVRTALYAPGDTTCATAPEAVAVVGYPAAASFPRIGYGYVANYGLSNLTTLLAPKGVSTMYVAWEDAQTVDFTINLAGLSVQPPGSQPPAGTFPDTFPAAFGDQSEALAQQAATFGVSQSAVFGQYAISGSTQPRAGWTADVDTLTGPALSTGGMLASYAVADAGTLTYAANGAVESLTVSDDAPMYALSRSPNDLAVTTSTFPLGPGVTQFTVGSKTALGEVSTPANFTTPPANGVTFRSDGTIVAANLEYVDSTNKVEVDLTSPDGVLFTLSALDLANGSAPLTNPAPLVLSPNDGPCDFSYTLFPIGTEPRYTDIFPDYGCTTATSPSRIKTRR